ncbi:MAG: hypothetical protein J7L50_00005 [Candidatus Odinarchaeota archaeon]|nr:hypothetical protein [Candidatus Odinarchaeota archaeon]
MLEVVTISMAVGILFGFILRKKGCEIRLNLSRLYLFLVYVLILIIGIKLGFTIPIEGLILYWFHSLMFSISTVIFSMILAFLFLRGDKR